jgi:hypothetical protein
MIGLVVSVERRVTTLWLVQCGIRELELYIQKDNEELISPTQC